MCKNYNKLAHLLICILISAIRFSEVSLLWQRFNSAWAFFVSLFCIWKNFDPSLAKKCVKVKFSLFRMAKFRILKSYPDRWTHCSLCSLIRFISDLRTKVGPNHAAKSCRCLLGKTIMPEGNDENKFHRIGPSGKS